MQNRNRVSATDRMCHFFSIPRGTLPVLTFTLLCKLLIQQYPAYGLAGLTERVVSQRSSDRILTLINMIDTSAVIRTSPQILERFLSNLRGASEKDPLLRQYVHYFEQVGPVIFEKEGTERVRIYQAAYDHFRATKNKRLQALSLHYIAQERFLLGQYGIAFEKSLQARELFRSIGYENIPEIGKYLHDMALNYYYFRDYERVKELMRTALVHKPFNPNLDIQRFNTLALSHRQTGDLDSTVYYFNKAKLRATHYNDSTWLALIGGNLGSVYADKGDFRKAMPLLKSDFLFNRNSLASSEMARNAALKIAAIWLDKGQLDSARYYVLEGEKLNAMASDNESFGQQQRQEGYLKDYYEVLNRYYRQLGDFRRAYSYLDSLHTITQKLDSTYNIMLAQIAQDKLRIQQYGADIELERQKSKTAAIRWFLVIAVLLFGVVVLGLLNYLGKVREAKQRALMQLRENEMQSQQRLTTVAFERAKDQLKYQLKLSEEKSQLIHQLKEELKKTTLNGENAAEILQEAITNLTNSRLLTQEDWVVFRRRFNAAFSNALDQLRKDHPDVTQAEERIYALMQLEVSTKQMASMLGISPESVRKAKYRLNKRLKCR